MRPEVGLHRERPVRSDESMARVKNTLDAVEATNGFVTVV